MKPEFKKEYYIDQIELMKKRYAIIFSKWHISWNKFFTYISNSMENNYFWIWNILIGTEKTIQECQNLHSKERRKYLYLQTKDRVLLFKRKIIYKERNISNYLDNL